MPSTIKLGVGDDAIEVEDGASVPLMGPDERGTIHRYDGYITLRFVCEGFFAHAAVITKDGSLVGRWIPYKYHIDLATLRRERAPKVETVGGWSAHRLEPGDSSFSNNVIVWESADHLPTHQYDGRFDITYWTHRPGNTPEKQAAFDAALDAWLGRYDAHGSSIDQIDELIKSARALGYGTQKP